MTHPAKKLTVLSKNPAVIVERKMSAEEAEMYRMLRDYRCHQDEGPACPARIIIGQAGVVLECPACGWVGQTYPDVESD
jgi:hypothetical protein